MGVLSRFVDLREGEAKPTLSVGGVLALLIGGHTVLETARDALFLSKLPPQQLTLVYVLLAVSSLASASAATAFAQRFGRRTALVFSLLACAYLVVVLWLRPISPGLVFLFYVLSGVMGTVLTLQFWLFAGEQFTVAQGKRLFGPIAAGGVIGATGGAALAAGLMRATSVTTLLPIGAAVFVLTAGALSLMQTEEVRSANVAKSEVLGWVKDLGLVAKDGYVGRIAIMTGVGTASVLIVDFLFKMVAAKEVPAAELGQFFATYYAVQNGVSLIVQIFLAGFIVRRFGVANSLLGLPSLLAISGAGAVIAGQSLPVAIAGKGSDGALRYSLHRVTSELLLLPVSPETRNRAKPLLDTVFGRGVQAVTAGLILGASAMGWGSARVLGGAVLFLSVLWLGMALMVRKPYVDLFRKALSLGEIAPSGSGDLNLPSVEALMESLSSRDEERVLAALDVLADGKRSRLVPGLILYHDSPKVLERALAIITAPDRKDWPPLAERLLDHELPSVRAAAVRALAAAGFSDVVAKGLLDTNEVVRAYAAFFLASRRDLDDDPMGDRRILAILDAPGDDGVRGRSALLGVIGEHGGARWGGVLSEALVRDKKRGLEAALVAAAVRRVNDPKFIPHLLMRLAAREGRGPVREALVAMGKPAFDAIVAAMRSKKTDPRVRLHLPRTLSRFGTQEAVDVLTERLRSEPDGATRFKILRGLGRLATEANTTKSGLKFEREAFEREVVRNLQEHLRLVGVRVALDRTIEGWPAQDTGSGAVLRGLLDDKIRQSLERAFRCLNIAHRHENIQGVYTAVQSTDKRVRANALEFLDALNLRTAGLRDLLRLVVDDLSPAERVRRAGTSLPRPAPEGPVEAIRRLLEDPEPLVAALAGFHALDLGLLALRNDVESTFEARPDLRELGGRSPGSQRITMEPPSHA